MADARRAGQPDDRSIESAEHARRRLEGASDQPSDRGRAEDHEVKRVREALRRHDARPGRDASR